MTRLRKLLALINMLCHRRQVTLESIMQTCGIARRTAFRYLNAISEANIPVFYDRRSGSYRLAAKTALPPDDFRPGEAILIVVALRALAEHTSEAYRGDIEDVITKIISRQPFQIEEVLRAFTGDNGNIPALHDYSDFLSSVLIHSAVACGRKLRLSTGSAPAKTGPVTIEQPALQFRDFWQLVDKGRGKTAGSAYRVADISKVDIL